MIAYMRDTDIEQILVIGNRGPEEHSAKALFVRQGGITDGIAFREVFTGPKLTVQNGYLQLSAFPKGVQIWQSVHS